MNGDCLERVGRTAREEPAHRSIHGGDDPAVYLKDDDQPVPGQIHEQSGSPGVPGVGTTHDPLPSIAAVSRVVRRFITAVSALSRSVDSSGQPASADGGRALTTKSRPCGFLSRTTAAAARSLRLTRLRVTAFPTFFPTINPNRLESAMEVTDPYSTTFRRPERAPERTVRENSGAVRILFTAGSMEYPVSPSSTGAGCYRRGLRIARSRWLGRLCREFGTALAAACRQNGTACAGTHAEAETVLLGTTAVIRLKGPLAHCNYSRTILGCARPIATRGRNRLTRLGAHPQITRNARILDPETPEHRHAPRPLSTRSNCDGMRNADMKDYITLGDRGHGRQTGCARLPVPNLPTAVDNRGVDRIAAHPPGPPRALQRALSALSDRYVLHFPSFRVGHGPFITSCVQLCG